MGLLQMYMYLEPLSLKIHASACAQGCRRTHLLVAARVAGAHAGYATLGHEQRGARLRAARDLQVNRPIYCRHLQHHIIADQPEANSANLPQNQPQPHSLKLSYISQDTSYRGTPVMFTSRFSAGCQTSTVVPRMASM